VAELSATPDGCAPFELSGGSLCLDFANTWADRGRPESDRLVDYGRLLAFARQTEAVSLRAARRLEGSAAARPDEARAAWRSACALREAIYRLFSAVAGGRPVAAADLDELNRALPPALARLRLEPRGDGFEWGWADATDSLVAPLAPIVRSAAELLASAERARVRECDAGDCTWLFLDRSRGGTRRWCSMASCGNRAKARRHYLRRRS